MPQGSTTSPQETAAAVVCSALHRAYRDLRFYPPDHPVARQSVDGLISAVAFYVEKWGVLAFEVAEGELVFEGEVIYSHETSRDNLAFLMFRDGVRALSLHPGIEGVEIEALVDCLAHADDLVEMDYDLATAFWERDFAHVDYRVADPFLGGEVLREGMIDALRETVLRRLEDSEVSTAPGQGLGPVELRDVEPSLLDGQFFQLTGQEIESGERAVEGLSAVLQDFAEVLLEIAGTANITAMDDLLAQSLMAVVEAYLENGDFEGVSFLVRRLENMEAQGCCPPGFVGSILQNAVDADHLGRLLRDLGQAQADEIKSLESLLTLLRPWIFPQLLENLAEAEDRAVRKTILALLGDENGVPWRDIGPFLVDPRWYVVRNAVQLAAAAGHIELTEHAPRLLSHGDARVRREILRALDRFGGQAVMSSYTRALSDPESSVRTLAARAIGRGGGPEQEGLLLAQVKDRSFALRPAEEVEAFLGSYAELAQERAVALLDRSWRKRLFSSRPAAFRVAAVLALGRVRSQSPRVALIAASKSRDTPIKRAAMHVLQSQGSQSHGGPN